MKDIIQQKALKIKLLLTDCDGVLTDGGVYYSDNCEDLKFFNMRGGMGVERLCKFAGIETAIITGEKYFSVIARTQKLQVEATTVAAVAMGAPMKRSRVNIGEEYRTKQVV